MKRILTLIPILLLISSVYGFAVNTTCLDSNTLYEEVSLDYYLNGTFESSEIWNHTAPCQYGCEYNNCKTASLMTETIFGFLFVMSAVFVGIGNHFENRFLGLIGGAMILIIGLYTVSSGVVVNEILYKESIVRIIGLILVILSIYLIYKFAMESIEEGEGEGNG